MNCHEENLFLLLLFCCCFVVVLLLFCCCFVVVTYYYFSHLERLCQRPRGPLRIFTETRQETDGG